MNNHKQTSIRRRNPCFLASLAVISAFSLAARADESVYGTVESVNGEQIVLKLARSTGHWKLDHATRREGTVEAADWAFAEVETSGHVKVLRFEERPTAHVGVIQKIHKHVLTVHSGPNIEEWNLKETTVLDGVAQADLKDGDEISVKLYKNHNLATLKVVKSGVGVK